MKYEQYCPRGFREEVVWNSQYFSHTNVWFPYKCRGKQTWPRRKKVKRQCTTIILATLVDLSSPMICAKIQPQGILNSGEDFERFLPYIVIAAILVNGQRQFQQSFVSPTYGGSTWNLSKIGSAASEEILTDGRTDGRTHRGTKSDHDSSSWAELRWAKKTIVED